jgi:hypothetical protein
MKTPDQQEQATITENDVDANIRLNRVKSIDITIDSLKQYILLSTVSIAGLIAFYNGNGKNGNSVLFTISVVAFLLCAISSVWNINTFINELHFSSTNVRKKELRRYNWIAISLFVVSVISSSIFIADALRTQRSDVNTSAKIIIKNQNTTVEIDGGVKASVVVECDSITKQNQILITTQ